MKLTANDRVLVELTDYLDQTPASAAPKRVKLEEHFAAQIKGSGRCGRCRTLFILTQRILAPGSTALNRADAGSGAMSFIAVYFWEEDG